MKGRELGSMYVANDFIQVIETEPAITVDDRREFAQLVGPDFGLYPNGSLIVTEWWALIENAPIAYACLTSEGESETVDFFAIVRPDYRGLGIGKFMVRCATDQAIRHRRRTILAKVQPGSSAIKILDDEEFELVMAASDSRPYLLFRKELKWQ